MSPSWQKRFDFFNAYGLPNSTPESKAAYKALTFLERVKLTSNILAFLFGPIYFFVKGMWRKGLTLLGIDLRRGGAGARGPQRVGFPCPCDRIRSCRHRYVDRELRVLPARGAG